MAVVMVGSSKVFQFFVHVIMILLALFCLLPFLLLIVSSVTAESTLIQNGYSFFTTDLDFAEVGTAHVSLPILATIALLVGLSYWNDWLNGLYYINDDKYYGIQVILNRMLMDSLFIKNNAGTALGSQLKTQVPTTAVKMAVAVLGAVPVLIIYPFFQKYFVKGVTIGVVKG